MSSSSAARRSVEYTVEPVTRERLAELWANLWERGVEEFRRLGMSPAQGMETAASLARLGRCGIYLADAVPIAVAGIAPDGRHAVSTWFQATNEFPQHARAVTRFLRGHVKGLDNVFIYSCCVHPDTARWFKVLGFAPDGWQGKTVSGYTITRFAKCA